MGHMLMGKFMQTGSGTQAHTQSAPTARASTSKAHSGSSSSIKDSEDSTSESG